MSRGNWYTVVMKHEPTIGMENAKEADTQEIVAKLRSLGIAVTLPQLEYTESSPIDFTEFDALSPQERGRLDELAQRAQTFLAAPLIIDSYGDDHDARRIWEKNMIAEHGVAFKEFLGSNKLGGNTMTPIVSSLHGICIILDAKGINTPKALRLKALYHEIPKAEKGFMYYGDFKEAQKLEMVSLMTDIAQSILQTLRKSPARR